MTATDRQGAAEELASNRRAASCVAALFAIGLWTGAVGAQDPLVKPLYIYSSQPILNQAGQPLPGHARANPSGRALVQILKTDNGLIHPPQNDGSPHPDNPLIAETGIGHLISPALTQPGRFAYSLSESVPAKDATFFVRAFNSPNLQGALFYGDSQVLTVQNDARVVYDAQIDKTDQIVDRRRDTDKDGLPDWWEHLHFGHATAADPFANVDGTGMKNWQQYLAGTDPNDPDSFLGITRIVPTGDANVIVEWKSVPDRKYRVQYTGEDLRPGPPFQFVSPVITATGHVTQVEIEGGFEDEKGHFRIKLIGN